MLCPLRNKILPITIFQLYISRRKSCKKAVCFAPRKHKIMINVSESGSPVKISRMRTQINSNDSIINNYTDITLHRDSSFAADQRIISDAVVAIGRAGYSSSNCFGAFNVPIDHLFRFSRNLGYGIAILSLKTLKKKKKI